MVAVTSSSSGTLEELDEMAQVVAGDVRVVGIIKIDEDIMVNTRRADDEGMIGIHQVFRGEDQLIVLKIEVRLVWLVNKVALNNTIQCEITLRLSGDARGDVVRKDKENIDGTSWLESKSSLQAYKEEIHL